MFNKSIFAVAALVWIAVTGVLVPRADAQTFVFTAIPDQDETRLRARFSKVADYLEGQLGVDVRYIPVKSYAAAVTAFRNDQVQLAWFGGLSGVQARRLVPGSEALAQGKEDMAFVTYFIAHKSAGVSESKGFPRLRRRKRMAVASTPPSKDTSATGSSNGSSFPRSGCKLARMRTKAWSVPQSLIPTCVTDWPWH